MVWACLGAIVCAYTQFCWTLWQLWQNTNTLSKWKRQRYTVMIGFFLFLNVFKFSILCVGLRHGVEKVKKEKCCSFLDNIMSNIQFEFCNICMYEWKFSKFVIVCTFWHMSVCILKFEMLVSFWFCFACRLPFSFFCFSVYFWDHVQYCITWAGSWTSCYIDIIYEYKNKFSLWRKF